MNFSKLEVLIMILIGLIIGTLLLYLNEIDYEHSEYLKNIAVPICIAAIILWGKISDMLKKRRSSKNKLLK